MNQPMTRAFAAGKSPASSLLRTSTPALLLWTSLWCNLNTGYSPLPDRPNLADIFLFVRGIVPFVVSPIAAFVLLQQKKLHLPHISPSRLLMAYGLAAAFATVFSLNPFWSFYWSAAFLSTILAAWTFVDLRHFEESPRQLLRITWVATFMVAVIVGYQARSSVFGSAPTGFAITELNGLSRASGVARWAAVPGLVCLVRAYYSRRRALIAFFLLSAAVSFYIVYRMQSRGAVFGSIAAVLFALLVSSRMRRYALPFAVLALVTIVLLDSPATFSNNLATYLERGQSKEDFLSMTGRTRAYGHAIAAIEDAPIFGRGQWADRMIIREHVHNSFLQALLNSGIVGGIPYFASWVVGWTLFYRLQKRATRLNPVDRVHVLECGTVMMFFTVRAIPETTTASYAVDLLVMVAVYVYLETLFLQTGLERTRKMIRPYAMVPYWVTESRKPIRAGAYRQV